MTFYKRLATLLCLLVTSVGCSSSDLPKLAPVAGKVTLNGTPLADAEIQFQPDHGRSSYGKTDREGNFQLEYSPGNTGAMIGTHTVRITTSQEVVTEATLDDGTGKSSAAPSVQLTKEELPPKFNTKSMLRQEVVAGPNNIFLNLETKP